jgi:glycosyltransferase involved in cell wall biosynthesis
MEEGERARFQENGPAPKVSVILPVFRMEKFVGKAIDSILAQLFSDFELVVVSEFGNSKESDEVIDSYRDSRVRVIKNNERLGLVRSLNLAIENSHGEYIAIMNADDISYPERLETQVAYLDTHLEIGVVGCAIVARIEKSGKEIFSPRETVPEVVAWLFLFNMPLINPSVMTRRKVLDQIGLFDPDFDYCEDYELWARATHVTQITNLLQPLVEYRVHSASATFEHSRDQTGKAVIVAKRELEHLLGRTIETQLLRTFLMPDKKQPPELRLEGCKLLLDIKRTYFLKNSLPDEAKSRIQKDLMRRMMELSSLCTTKSPLTSFRIFLMAAPEAPSHVFVGIRFYLRYLRDHILYWR